MSTIINRDKKVRVPAFDFFSPALAYPLLVIIFMLLGIGGMTLGSFLLFAAFIISFLAGFRFSRPGEKRRYPIIWRLGLPLFVLGAAAEFINIIYVGALPLVVPSLRMRLMPSLAYISFLIVPGTIIRITDSLLNGRKTASVFWLISGTFLISLLGYRTEIFALLLGAFLSAYYVKGARIKSGTALKYGTVFIVALVALTLFVSSFRDTPLASFMERFSMTTYVFSSLVDHMGVSLLGESGGLIHKSILSSLMIIPGPKTGPRTFISQLIGVSSGSTTPTIIGIPFVDFGVAGVVLAGLLLGLLFGSGYKMLRRGDVDVLPLHVLCMAFLIITIETGIADTIVLLYFLAYLIIVI